MKIKPFGFTMIWIEIYYKAMTLTWPDSYSFFNSLICELTWLNGKMVIVFYSKNKMKDQPYVTKCALMFSISSPRTLWSVYTTNTFRKTKHTWKWYVEVCIILNTPQNAHNLKNVHVLFKDIYPDCTHEYSWGTY